MELYLEVSQVMCKDENEVRTCIEQYGKEVTGAVFLSGCVRSMWDGFFASCPSLRRVTFLNEDCLVLIGKEAFSKCKELKEIKIPSSVEEIGERCFSGCSSLSRVIFGSESRLKRIGNDAFSGCSVLEKIEIPAGVEVLNSDTFTGCKNLSSVTFGDGSCLRRIEGSIFSETIVDHVTLPSSIEEIEGHLFNESGGSITLNSDKFVILNGLIMTTDRTKIVSVTAELDSSVTIPASVEVIGDYSFYIKTISSVTFEPGSQLRVIGKHAFEGSNAEEISIHECQFLKEIGESAFAGITISGEFVIPKSVEKIGDDFLADCGDEMDIVFEEGSQIKVITSRMFRDCRPASIILPNVEEIEDNAFQSLACDVVLQEGLKKLGNDVFCGDIVKSIKFPDSLKEMPDNLLMVQGHNYLEHVDWGHGITVIPYAICEESSIYNVFIPNTVEEISDNAFAGVSDADGEALTLTFEENSRLRAILSGAFSGHCFSSDNPIVIPKSVEIIGDDCFGRHDFGHDGEELVIEFEEGSQLKEIGERAFGNDHTIERFEIPALVEKLDNAFEGCTVNEMILHPENKNFYIDTEQCAILTADRSRVVTYYRPHE